MKHYFLHMYVYFICLGRAVSMYTGAKAAPQYPVGASFNHTEDYSEITIITHDTLQYPIFMTFIYYVHFLTQSTYFDSSSNAGRF